MSPKRALFVNVEPSSATSCPEDRRPVLEEALASFPLAEDLRARSPRRPRRRRHRPALAPMPFLRPDVIKLDLKLMHNSPSREIAEVVHAAEARA
jgi:hypothetical protein